MGRGSFVSPSNRQFIKDYILSDFDVCVNEALKTGITKGELIERIENNEVKP